MTQSPSASRRRFLQALVALGAQASLNACRQPEEAVVAQLNQASALATGEALHFATALTLMGTAFGVVVESHDSRPTKIEGNPRHPESLGGSNAFLQAALYNLYDPDRSRSPSEQGSPRSVAQAIAMLGKLREAADQDGGARLAIVTDAIRSPTTLGQIAALKARYPKARLVCHEPLASSEAKLGSEAAFGKPLEAVPNWAAVDFALVLDGDPFGLEGSPLRATREWMGRPGDPDERRRRLVVIESCLSITGSVADYRYACESHRVFDLLSALTLTLETLGAITLGPELRAVLSQHQPGSNASPWKRRLQALGRDLIAHRGKGLVVVGARQPPRVHALAHWLNFQLGNLEHTCTFWPSLEDKSPFAVTLEELSSALMSGSVQQVLVIRCNAAYSSVGDVDFAAALTRAKLSVHVGEYFDETARFCHWHINLAHELETFGDTQTREGVASIVQPLVAPLWQGKSTSEVLSLLLGREASAYDLVRDFWRTKLDKHQFESLWRKALLNGTIGEAPSAVAVPAPNELKIAEVCSQGSRLKEGAIELVFSPSHSTFDGRFANNGWLQELPCPITTLTWGNAAWISKSLAMRRNLHDGQVIRLSSGTKSVSIPVIIVPGQATDSITLTVGHGHAHLGKVANGVGANVYPLRRESRPWVLALDGLEVMPQTLPLARTQSNFDDEGRKLARRVDDLSTGTQLPQTHSQPLGPRSLEGRAWGLTIDLNRCTGCNACVVACQVENNIPVVGREGILSGRGMHWLRVDRYFREHNQTLSTLAQPVPCQQCENAPCETVCPVGATAHSPEGLNDMVYNRCVGSRYCANNCPFKVRKFNYFEYNGGADELVKLRHNPEVTVRSRGVMEKCTFCVQRINRAKVQAKLQGLDEIADGQINPACAQTCPATAIVFGDLHDERSRVTKLHRSKRAYTLLEELGLVPRVAYLAKARNINPELEEAE